MRSLVYTCMQTETHLHTVMVEVTSLTINDNNNTYWLNSLSLAVWWQTKNRWAVNQSILMTTLNGLVYIYTNIETAELATNRCPKNGLHHIHIMECPGDYKTFSLPQSAMKLTSLCNATGCWLTVTKRHVRTLTVMGSYTYKKKQLHPSYCFLSFQSKFPWYQPL